MPVGSRQADDVVASNYKAIYAVPKPAARCEVHHMHSITRLEGIIYAHNFC